MPFTQMLLGVERNSIMDNRMGFLGGQLGQELQHILYSSSRKGA
jgi:hypothetical protein